MYRIPDFQTDLLFSQNAAGEAPESAAPAEKTEGVQATTTQPVPLKPQATGHLEPISGMQTFILIMFAVLSFIMLVGIVRFGSKNNYGD